MLVYILLKLSLFACERNQTGKQESKDITEVTSDGGVSEELGGTAEYPISVRRYGLKGM